MPDTPKFETFEEMEEWMNAQSDTSSTKASSSKAAKKAPKASASSPKKKQTRKKKSTSRQDEGTRLVTETFSEEFTKGIWSSVHFYMREGDTIAKVRADAKEEAKFRNENVLVFYHEHFFGQACTNLCGRAKHDGG